MLYKKKLVLGLVLGFLFLFASTAAYALGPLSTYCRKWNQCVDSKWKPVAGFEEPRQFYVRLDGRGLVSEIKEDRGMPEAQKLLGHRFISALRGLPQPPQRVPSPFWVEVYLCNDEEQRAVQVYNLDWGSWMNDMERTLKANWNPPHSAKPYQVMVRFSVSANGNASKIKVAKSGGDALRDSAATDAVKNATPFKAFPDGAPTKVDIEFSFDHKVNGVRAGAENK